MQYLSFGSLCCLFLVSFFNCFHLLFVFYDIGSDCKVTLWERAARSVYNVFCTMSSLNKGDVHNCQLYVTIEIDTIGVRAGCKDDKNHRRLV